MNILHTIEQLVKQTTANLYDWHDAAINLETKKQFGDITTNCAMILAKQLKKPPMVIAEEIKKQLKHHYIEKVEVAPPGFINIYLSKEGFTTLTKQLFEQGEQFFVTLLPRKSFNIEFVSANPTGPLHIGHGRGGIIGDVLAKVLRFQGQKVTTEFYINDAGNQMQKLGMSFNIRCQQQMGNDSALPEDAYHGEYLISLAQECYNTYGEELKTKDESFFVAYAKDHLLERIQTTLKDYGITFDEWFSEKTLHESGAIAKVLKQLEANGYIYEKEGAKWFRATKFGDDKDRVVQKNTGELTYVAADIAYAENKFDRGTDQLIMILGQDHHSYVIRLKAVLQALGYDPNRLDVILYQLVTIKEDGLALRLSKRAGRIVTLRDIIDIVGTDVARFFYLHKKADAHLDFDVDLALKHTEENPVYYIQYAYVRTKSIIEKSQAYERLHNITYDDCSFIDEPEYMLLKKIAMLQGLLEGVTRTYQTHLLTYYVIELAQTFHSYYSHHKVIDPDQVEQSRGRLLMVLLVQHTIKTCLDLLGISAPEKM